MKSNIRLSTAMHSALTCGVPVTVVCSIIAIQHRGKLGRLFGSFAVRFLKSFATAHQQPNGRLAAKHMLRAKAILDLIRARQQSLGKDKPNDKQILKWSQEAEQPRIVQLRTAA